MRNIYIINAQVINKNGDFFILDGFPKHIDARSYEGDVDKARRMADAVFCDTWAEMCRDNNERWIQSVFVTDIFGNILDRKSMGNFPADPAPEGE